MERASAASDTIRTCTRERSVTLCSFVPLAIAILFVAVRVTAGGNPAYAPDSPAVVSLITLGQPDADNLVTVTAAPGCVPANSYVMAVDLSIGQYAIVHAAADGSFKMSLIAPPGTTLLFKVDPLGKLLPAFDETAHELYSKFGALPGALLRVPDRPPLSSDGTPFSAAGPTGVTGAYFEARGTINKLSFQTGESLTINTSIVVHSPALDASAHPTVSFSVQFARVATSDGTQMAMATAFGSTFMTPTELPIERAPVCGTTAFKFDVPFALTATSGRAQATRSVSINIPSQLPPGHYQPYLTTKFDGIPAAPAPKGVIPVSPVPNNIPAPIIRIGNPAAPRLSALLFADTWSNGVRGVRAAEDSKIYGFASQIATQSDVLVLPRAMYRVEPYLPVISVSQGGNPMPEPRVPLKLPSGSVTVRVTRPDGSTATIGPAPFVQARSIAPAKDNGETFDFGSHHPGDVYQLSTMDSRFDVNFGQYGRYRIALDGSVDDLWGTTWRITGSYDVTIAEPLVLDTSVLPGTGFEVGDIPSFVVTTIPPLAADIDATFRLAPQSDASRMQVTSSRGRANRFGMFSPVLASTVVDESGEYRMDIAATYQDSNGVLWAGSRRWGGVVAPKDSELIVHGRRGVFFQSAPRQQWFFESQSGSVPSDGHPTFPFLSGDVIWVRPNAAMLIGVNQQDVTGMIDSLVASRCPPQDALPGETPFVSSRPDKLDAHLDLTGVDFWSYAYATVERPLIRVREVIGDGIAGHLFGYWQFREQYGAQRGVANGDRPDDFKFLFAGGVSRGRAIGKAKYGIYGALFVALPYDDSAGTRVFPPFQGNGGGPSGGPIMTLKGKPIDLFFHATAVRPGTILERGNTATFAGYVAPSLPANIQISVTSPSGERRTISGKANRVGYFNAPSAAFQVDEVGVWKATVTVVFDGVTSAGQVQAPYPTGDLLGSRQGEFYFYVVGANEPPLAVTPNARQSNTPFVFNVSPPVALTNAVLTETTMMPGVVLEENTTSTLQYTYDAAKLAQQFPNLDVIANGISYFDTITLSFLVTGTDGSGARRSFAREIVLQGDELQMPAQKETIAPPRRRAARH